MRTENEDKRGLRSVIDWLAEQFGSPRREESFSDLSERYEQALSRWEDSVGAIIMLREWRKGNLFLDMNPKFRRDGDLRPSVDLRPDEIEEAQKYGVKLDDVFFARGQYSLEKLWDSNAPSLADPEREPEGPDLGRDI